MNTPRSMKRMVLCIAALGMLCGIALWGLSSIPFEWIKPRIDALAVDGDAENFTPAAFARLAQRLKIGGAILIALSLLLFAARKPIAHHLSTWYNTISFADIYDTFSKYLRTAWAEADPAHKTALILILLLGIGLRIAFLFQPIRHDEAFTVTNYASKPLFVGLSNYSFPNNHLFHTFLVHIAYLLFGDREWAVRLPAFFSGIALLPAAYLLIRTLYNARIALLSLSLIAISSPLIEYATNARGYALIGLFFLIQLGLVNHLKHHPSAAGWIAYTLAGALGLYTVPVMLYPLAFSTTYFALSVFVGDAAQPRTTQYRNLLLSGIATLGLTALLYAPTLLGSGTHALFSNRFVKSAPTWSSLFEGLSQSWRDLLQEWTLDYPLPLILVLALSLIAGLWRYRTIAAHRIPLPLAACIIPILLIAQRVVPPERVYLFLLPLVLSWTAMGIAVLCDAVSGRAISTQRRKDAKTQKRHPIGHLSDTNKDHHPCTRHTLIPILILIAIALPGAIRNLSGYYPYGPGTLYHAEAIAQYLKPQLMPHDRVLTIATAAPLEYHFNRHQAPIAALRTPLDNAERIFLIVMQTKYTLEDVLSLAQIPPEAFTPPRLLQPYDSATLYLLERQ